MKTNQPKARRDRVVGARRMPCPAFSLVELLVVVSLITTLLAIVAPSLRNAREQARIAVCLGQTSSIGRAAAAYSTDGRGWLCGSPGTSGSVMYDDPPSDPLDEDIPTDPMQIWDYAGALGPTYMNTSLPPNRSDRFAALIDGVFACPSNQYEADPIQGSTGVVGPVGSFLRRKMVSYNTFRNFLMWPRTMIDWDPSRPWGPVAPVPEASFDTIGGHTLRPKNFRPHIDRIVNPAQKVYLADGNRYTDSEGNITYDVEWNAEAGGAFCNGGPTLPLAGATNDYVLSAYHTDEHLGKIGYRHQSSGSRGIVIHCFDGHGAFLSETESREPDWWWPRGTVIPFSDFNDASRRLVVHRLDADYKYHVGR